MYFIDYSILELQSQILYYHLHLVSYQQTEKQKAVNSKSCWLDRSYILRACIFILFLSCFILFCSFFILFSVTRVINHLIGIYLDSFFNIFHLYTRFFIRFLLDFSKKILDFLRYLQFLYCLLCNLRYFW